MKPIKGKFEFKTLEDIATGPADYGKGVIRISGDHARLSGKNAIRRNSMVKLKCDKKLVFAIVRYTPRLQIDQIAMEYDLSRDLLASDTKERSANLTIRKVPFWEYSKFFYKHPDPVIRYAERLSRFRAFAAFALGVGVAVAVDVLLDGALGRFLPS